MTEQTGETGELAHTSQAGRGESRVRVRVVLPAHLQALARSGAEVALEVAAPATQRAVLDALEASYPALRGTTRDHATRRRRPFIRFFACGEDLSNELPDTPLPESVASDREPFIIIGAIAGG